MNFFRITALFLAAVGCAHAATIPTTGRLSNAEAAELKRKVDAAGGCNANVCFAIDGSGSLSQAEFDAEKNFVIDLMAVIGVDEPIEVAAVQYGVSNSAIQPLTPDTSLFISKLVAERFLRAPGTSVVSGISYCFGELVRRPGEANKIVLLGDGRNNIGSSAIERANLFRAVGGEVCAVGAGFQNEAELLGIAGGDPSKVFQVGSFLDTLALRGHIEALVAGICKIKLS